MLIQIHVRRAVGRGYSYIHLYMCVCNHLYVYLFMCVTPPGQTKNDTDLKFSTHALLDHIQEQVFLFFLKSDPESRQP